MTNLKTIRQSLISRLSVLRDNTSIIENSDNLDFTNIEDGVLVVYADWSGQAIVNCIQTIRTLYEKNYNGQIFIVDTDCMTPAFQIEILGQVCHGWGEIFIIRDGKVRNKYLGKNSFINYKADSD